MANTFTQIYIHSVFTVKNRECIILPNWEEEVYKYITGIVQNNGHKMLAINGMPDHIHVFVNMQPVQAVSEMIQKIKANSSRWINQNKLVKGKFTWQEGFGAFSYSISQIDQVVKYIMNQKEHHSKESFRDEYMKILHQFEIEFKDNYLFDFFDYEK
jgi:REP element-mobilizing transposase RayT